MSCLICGKVQPFKIAYHDAGICFGCVRKATADFTALRAALAAYQETLVIRPLQRLQERRQRQQEAVEAILAAAQALLEESRVEDRQLID